MTRLLEAVKKGCLEDVQSALECGECVDSTDEDGWTPLTSAAADGHLDIIKLLLEWNANINFPNQCGETALSRAVFGGHMKVTRLLLDKGADIEFADEDGDTPLLVAVICRRLELARFLLTRKANMETRNKNGMTALTMAYQYGLRDFVELLQLYHGAQWGGERMWRTARGLSGWVYQLVGISPASEPEEETSVWPRSDVLASSVKNAHYSEDRALTPDKQLCNNNNLSGLTCGERSPTDLSMDLPHTSREESIIALFPVLLDLCSGMVETQNICEDILERLQRAQCRLDEQGRSDNSQVEISIQLITARFHAFLLQHTKQPSVERLVGTRTILGLLEGFHHEIDEVIAGCFPAGSVSILTNWKEGWDDAVIVVEKCLVSSWDSSLPALSRELPDTESQTDALLLLNSETTRHRTRYSARSHELLESVAKKVARLSGAPTPKIPPWFIPRHEIQRHPVQFASGSFGKVYHGMWRGSKVVIKCVNVVSAVDRKAFLREATIWHRARHPHIVNFFGACHQSHPCFFVCEEAGNGNLVDYLDKMKGAGRSLIWLKLHEAALGLLFLHQNNIVHGDLKCNQILVGGDGKAKLTDFGLSFVSSESKPKESGGATRWRAPECLGNKGQIPTFESDIYSFGMCVVEAVTYTVPWGIYLPDDAVMDHLRHRTFLPRPKQFIKDEEWEFVLGLCAFEASKRLKLLDVIEQLAIFARALSSDNSVQLTIDTESVGTLQPKRLSKKGSLELLMASRKQQIYQAEYKVFHAILSVATQSRYVRVRHAVQTIQFAFRYRKQQEYRQQNKTNLLKAKCAKTIMDFMYTAYARKRYLRFVAVIRVLQCRFRYYRLLRVREDQLKTEQNLKPTRKISFAWNHLVVEPSLAMTSINDTEDSAPEQRLDSNTLEVHRAAITPQPREPYHSPWINDEDRPNCNICNKSFTLLRRKHHCRVCFEIICSNCSLTRKKMRVCVVCAGLQSAERIRSSTQTQSHPRRRGGFWRNFNTLRSSLWNDSVNISWEEEGGLLLSTSHVGLTRLWDDDEITAARIPRNAVTIESRINRGAFGEIHLGTWNGMQVAVKMLLPELRKNMSEINQFLGEAKIMASMEHPCIINLLGIAWDSLSDACMVVEYMDGGDLRSLLNHYQETQHAVGFDTTKANIAKDVCHALTYLHSLALPVIHRDLKSRNILLDRSLQAKVTDFGISRKRVNSTMTAGVGTSLWMAPEVIMGKRYNEKADIFSFGVVLSELNVHSMPYSREGHSVASIIQMVILGKLSVQFSQTYPLSVAELGNACVSLNPVERPTASEALYTLLLILQDLE